MLKFNKVLLASDFDNTLVYTQGALERGEDIPPMSARNREAVEYFIQNGGYFSISTGRALPAFARYAKDLPCNAPCVIANGAAIYDFNKDCYVETAFLDADIYDHVDALLARFPGLCFEIYHDDRRIHVLHPNDYTRNHEHLTRAKTEEVKDFREVDLPIIKLLFEEEKPLLEQVRDFIVSQEWGKRYELIFSSDHLLELTRRGATKGGMILTLAKLLGVARKDIYCIGDHNNDIPMLEVSEIGFAPENAIPEVKEWGAHIVCHCKDGALADVVEILDNIDFKKATFAAFLRGITLRFVPCRPQGGCDTRRARRINRHAHVAAIYDRNLFRVCGRESLRRFLILQIQCPSCA